MRAMFWNAIADPAANEDISRMIQTMSDMQHCKHIQGGRGAMEQVVGSSSRLEIWLQYVDFRSVWSSFKLWHFLIVLSALLNVKSLPFAWHFRLLSSLLLGVRSSRKRLRSRPGPSLLFTPVITISRNNAFECDYNLHKSNSTYFSDFDIGRLQCIIRTMGFGIDEFRQGDNQGLVAGKARTGTEKVNWLEVAFRSIRGKETKSGTAGSKASNLSFTIPLGGVTCNFLKEIKPFEKYEVWTRILTWDKKWLFVIGHFVKPGTMDARRASETYKPWNRVHDRMDQQASQKPVIFATALAKYCFKRGRITVPPEDVLRASNILLEKPIAAKFAETRVDPQWRSEPKLKTDDLNEGVADSDDWTWQRVEDERQRGMKIADLYMGLDKLNEELIHEEAVHLTWL